MKNKILQILFALIVVFATNQASAYYSPSTGRWLSRDPMGEPGFELLRASSAVPKVGQVASAASLPPSRLFKRDPIVAQKELNPYGFLQNDSMGKIDYLGETAYDLWLKMHNQQVPKAVGLTAGGAFVSKIPGLRGIIVGLNTSIMFFPDTCEVSAYSVTALSLTNNMQGGIFASIGTGGERAHYFNNPTPGQASAASYGGPFSTILAGYGITGSAFWGKPDQHNGVWVGGSLTAGPPGAGLAGIVYDYEFMQEFTITVPKCACYTEILLEP
jgi:hypothetical protein